MIALSRLDQLDRALGCAACHAHLQPKDQTIRQLIESAIGSCSKTSRAQTRLGLSMWDKAVERTASHASASTDHARERYPCLLEPRGRSRRP